MAEPKLTMEQVDRARQRFITDYMDRTIVTKISEGIGLSRSATYKMLMNKMYRDFDYTPPRNRLAIKARHVLQYMFDYMRKNNGLTPLKTEIAEHTGFTEWSVDYSLKYLADIGVVDEIKRGRFTVYRVRGIWYSVAKDVLEFLKDE